MTHRYVILALAILSVNRAALAVPNHLDVPGVYDNVGNGISWGQTFVSEEPLVLGARWYIKDPARPDEPSVNELVGPADLVLYDAASFASPIELARAQVLQGSNDSFSGLSTLMFAAPVATSVGSTYYIAVEASDPFGIGLRSLGSSTYPGGSQAFISSGVIQEVESGRDTSFEILSAVPQPQAVSLVVAGIGVALWHFRGFAGKSARAEKWLGHGR